MRSKLSTILGAHAVVLTWALLLVLRFHSVDAISGEYVIFPDFKACDWFDGLALLSCAAALVDRTKTGKNRSNSIIFFVCVPCYLVSGLKLEKAAVVLESSTVSVTEALIFSWMFSLFVIFSLVLYSLFLFYVCRLAIAAWKRSRKSIRIARYFWNGSLSGAVYADALVIFLFGVKAARECTVELFVRYQRVARCSPRRAQREYWSMTLGLMANLLRHYSQSDSGVTLLGWGRLKRLIVRL